MGPERTRKPVLTPAEAKNWRLAKLFDLRSFIGALLLIFGVLVIIPGIVASPATINKAAGLNLALWEGGLMLVVSAIFLTWVVLKPPQRSAPIWWGMAGRIVRLPIGRVARSSSRLASTAVSSAK